MASDSKLEQLDRDVQDGPLVLSDHLSMEAANHAANADTFRNGRRNLEQSIADNIGAMISGVENRFSNERESPTRQS